MGLTDTEAFFLHPLGAKTHSATRLAPAKLAAARHPNTLKHRNLTRLWYDRAPRGVNIRDTIAEANAS